MLSVLMFQYLSVLVDIASSNQATYNTKTLGREQQNGFLFYFEKRFYRENSRKDSKKK